MLEKVKTDITVSKNTTSQTFLSRQIQERERTERERERDQPIVQLIKQVTEPVLFLSSSNFYFWK